MTNRLRWVVPAVSLLSALAACKQGGEIASVRDAIASGDETKIDRALDHSPVCDSGGRRADDGCLARVAGWLGSKTGFHVVPPDQSGAATAAVVVLRGRGEQVPMPDVWISTIREGNGDGADTLRLATATRMAAELKGLARPLTSDDDARALMRGVARSVAGACETYALVAAGVDEGKMAPELTVDHAPCVQKDLDRATGPAEHGLYGVAMGPWRGAEGALAVWKETARALREGMPHAEGGSQDALAAKITGIEEALGKVVTKKLTPPDPASSFGAIHADAGVPMVAPRGRGL
jgi:hypothetical protein